MTVTSHETFSVPAEAVIVAVPSLTALTNPFVTVATAVLLLFHFSVLSVASAGLTVAVSWTVSFCFNLTVVLFNETDVTGMTFFSTVTAQVALLPPQLAVIVAVPSLTAVTFPPLTVATAVLELDQVTVCSVASDGLTVAVRVEDSPSISVKDVLLIVTDVTGTGFF